MTKQELQTMITAAVRKVVKEEIKPLIETTIKREFYKILDDAESAESAKLSKTLMVDNVEPQETSLMSLIEEDRESDPARAEVNERIFKGKIPFKGENPFAEILNQTATEVETRSGIYANPMKVSGNNDQIKVNLNPQSVVENTQPPAKMPLSKESMVAMIGYGDMEKVGGGESILGAEINPKSTPLTEIELPTKNADGLPIDYSKVPTELVQNMMKNYSGLMKKVETKVRRPE